MKVSSSLVLLLAFIPLTSAFPGFLVNSCDRNLQVGETIMGVAVAPSTNAPMNQDHSVSLVDAAGNWVCGTTVAQGAELFVQVDATLASLVAADGWTQGVGPNYIIEATNSFLQVDSDANLEVGCSNTRVVNPGESTTVFPLQSGDMVVRLLAAYGFGQVWASEECTVTVEGSMTVAQHAGYLVDNASWRADPETLSTMPYLLTAEELLAGSASGYSVLELLDDETFAVKYAIDDSDVDVVIAFLETLALDDTDIQVQLSGFESEDGSSVDVLTFGECSGSATCDGFFSVPTDQVCLTEGLCVESAVVDDEAGTLTTTIVSNDDSWFGIGFSTPGGGMTGGGAGSDIFVCSAEGLRRFLVTVRDNPANTAQSAETIVEDAADAEAIKNLCVIDTESGTGRMTFTRGLENDGPRSIVSGEAQAIIFARGPLGLQTLTAQHPASRRGELSLDLTNVAGGVSVTKQSAPWILWLHIVFMSLSWGLCLPLAVILASRTRDIGPKGRWFGFHKHLARSGWVLQTMGALFGVYYCEVYSLHLTVAHQRFGVFIAIAGFLQPISAVLRPHPPKEGWPNGKPAGRTAFEVYHKGVGWTATICGIINVFLGAALARDLSFQNAVSVFPIVIGVIGLALFASVLGWSFAAEKRVDDEGKV